MRSWNGRDGRSASGSQSLAHLASSGIGRAARTCCAMVRPERFGARVPGGAGAKSEGLEIDVQGISRAGSPQGGPARLSVRLISVRLIPVRLIPSRGPPRHPSVGSAPRPAGNQACEEGDQQREAEPDAQGQRGDAAISRDARRHVTEPEMFHVASTRTRNTPWCALRRTRSATLPISSESRRERPCVPITITCASISSAVSRIVIAGLPS